MKGQEVAKRALEIAAAGGHSLLFVGPPGSGKSMLAHRLPGLLPPMSDAEALQSAALAGLAAGLATGPAAAQTTVRVAYMKIPPLVPLLLPPRRGLRPRPAASRSNQGLGRARMSLATTPICQGITR